MSDWNLLAQNVTSPPIGGLSFFITLFSVTMDHKLTCQNLTLSTPHDEISLETIGDEIVSGPECLAESCWQPMCHEGWRRLWLNPLFTKIYCFKPRIYNLSHCVIPVGRKCTYSCSRSTQPSHPSVSRKNEEQPWATATMDTFRRFTSPEPGNWQRKLVSDWRQQQYAVGSEETKGRLCCR